MGNPRPPPLYLHPRVMRLCALYAVPLQVVSGPEILNKYVGESERNMRELFAAAEEEYREKGLLPLSSLPLLLPLPTHRTTVCAGNPTEKQQAPGEGEREGEDSAQNGSITSAPPPQPPLHGTLAGLAPCRDCQGSSKYVDRKGNWRGRELSLLFAPSCPSSPAGGAHFSTQRTQNTGAALSPGMHPRMPDFVLLPDVACVLPVCDTHGTVYREVLPLPSLFIPPSEALASRGHRERPNTGITYTQSAIAPPFTALLLVFCLPTRGCPLARRRLGPAPDHLRRNRRHLQGPRTQPTKAGRRDERSLHVLSVIALWARSKSIQTGIVSEGGIHWLVLSQPHAQREPSQGPWSGIGQS